MTTYPELTQVATINVPENNRNLVEQAANETKCAVEFIQAIDAFGKPVSGRVGLELIEEKKDYTPFWKRLNELRKAAGLPYFK